MRQSIKEDRVDFFFFFDNVLCLHVFAFQHLDEVIVKLSKDLMNRSDKNKPETVCFYLILPLNERKESTLSHRCGVLSWLG